MKNDKFKTQILISVLGSFQIFWRWKIYFLWILTFYFYNPPPSPLYQSLKNLMLIWKSFVRINFENLNKCDIVKEITWFTLLKSEFYDLSQAFDRNHLRIYYKNTLSIILFKFTKPIFKKEVLLGLISPIYLSMFVCPYITRMTTSISSVLDYQRNLYKKSQPSILNINWDIKISIFIQLCLFQPDHSSREYTVVY